MRAVMDQLCDYSGSKIEFWLGELTEMACAMFDSEIERRVG